MSIEARLREMGLTLPPPFQYPSPNRTGCVQVGSLLYTSGHPPPADFGVAIEGKVENRSCNTSWVVSNVIGRPTSVA